MKISKILAGLSAAAMAASMLSMVVSADDAAGTAAATSTVIAEGSFKYEKEATAAAWGVDSGVSVSLKDDITAFEDLDDYSSIQVTAEISNATGTEADKFGLSFYDMGSSNWSWNVPGQAQFEGGKLEFTFAPSAVNPKGDEEVGDIGIQVFIDGAEEGKTYTADVKYTVTGLTGTTTNPEPEPEAEKAKCDCTAETCDKWDAEKNQCGCGCNDTVELGATLGFAAGGWFPQDWATTTKITADGTYTIKFVDRADDGAGEPNAEPSAFDGAVVFVVDIPDVYETGYKKVTDKETKEVTYEENPTDGAYNANGEKWSDDNPRQLVYPNFKVVLDKITVDGKEIAFDAAKIIYGNLENNKTNYRIEIYNEYGSTKEDSPIDLADIKGSDLEITFTVSGLSKECTCNKTVDNSSSDVSSETSSENSTDSKDTSSSSKATNNASGTNPGTGTAALAVVGIALAGAAAVTAKKRK
ncbi:MAG: NPXTG-anchored protein [Ruminococcus sp.]|nr:NPXTG-anchored protein [Ruminococcus sp.]